MSRRGPQAPPPPGAAPWAVWGAPRHHPDSPRATAAPLSQRGGTATPSQLLPLKRFCVSSFHPCFRENKHLGSCQAWACWANTARELWGPQLEAGGGAGGGSPKTHAATRPLGGRRGVPRTSPVEDPSTRGRASTSRLQTKATAFKAEAGVSAAPPWRLTDTTQMPAVSTHEAGRHRSRGHPRRRHWDVHGRAGAAGPGRAGMSRGPGLASLSCRCGRLWAAWVWKGLARLLGGNAQAGLPLLTLPWAWGGWILRAQHGCSSVSAPAALPGGGLAPAKPPAPQAVQLALDPGSVVCLEAQGPNRPPAQHCASPDEPAKDGSCPDTSPRFVR